MKTRRIPVSFLFAAAPFLSAATTATAEGETETPPVDPTPVEVWNVNGTKISDALWDDDAGLNDLTDKALTVHQDANGALTGKISGTNCSLVKKGAANLTLAGEIALGTGTITVAEGALTFGADVSLPAAAFTVRNSGTVVLAQNGDSDALRQLTISDPDKAGLVVNVGTGTTTVSGLEGDELHVNSGTLVVRNTTNFNEIAVAGGAALQIGTGANDSLAHLFGNVSLEENAALVFNRKATTSADNISYTGRISGAGDVVGSGSAVVYFAGGTDQTYTGTTTLDAGGMIFRRATLTGGDGNEYYDPSARAAVLHSSKVSVNAANGSAGMFGGHVTVRHDVEVNGTDFASYSDWTGMFGSGSWGAWYAGAGTLYASSGDTLTIEGDLQIAKTEIRPVYSTENGVVYVSDFSGNSGGAVRVEFGGAGAGEIVAKGNVELGGTLLLVGADGLAPGQVSVFFRSDPAKTTGAFDNVVYGSDNVTLLLPGVGGIRDGQLGIATTENRNVRRRASFVEHDGLKDFVDYLVSEANGMNRIAQAVSLAGADAVTDVVNNLSPLAYSAFPEMALRQSEREWDMILLELSRSRDVRPESPDGVRVPANLSLFSGLVTDFVDHESDDDTPVYDFNSVGAYAGAHTWLDDERAAGFALGVHRSSARPHGGGGTLEDAALRAKLFAVFSPKFSEWFLTLGGTFGAHHYDADRRTALGPNSASTSGVDAGLFVALNSRTRLERNLFFTPYIRLEYNFSYVGSLSESGSASRLNIDRMTVNTYRARFGSGFEYRASEGRILALDFGFNATFGDRMDIVSEFAEYENSRTKTGTRVGERMTFEVAPRVGLDLGDGWTADAVFRAECSFEGSWSQSFGVGFGKRF